ncbi:hypothetical protein FACS18949_11920 [Clostridia bacterium]|nr:hypothetical protein FACS18949_11920 [Clostridia bacterium]
MRLIYVCSPCRGDPPYTEKKLIKNIKNASEYSAFVVNRGHIPITPHLYFNSFLADEKPDDRETGMNMGMELLKICNELWVFDKISEGMQKEIDEAHMRGIPVSCILYERMALNED